ncbi:MAG TPA: winged helix-turn-helix domain-containing protein [Steroidobacteraceae bacterium]|nr:winged helix-turn-helix domain-containing protein [Steroidobacteraceae bacterium]
MSDSPAIRRVRFADFEADLRSQELFRGGASVRLPNQSFLALVALLERPGELVTREELRVRLWPGNRVVEFEQGLNAIINRLREALGDDAENPNFIETLPRRGYRFVAQLTPDTQNLPTARVASPPPAPPTDVVLPRPRATQLAAGIAAIALSLVLAAVWWALRPATEAATTRPLTTLLGQEGMPALSRDGESLVFAWDGETGSPGGFDLFARSIGSQRLTQLTHSPAVAVAAAWSPDGGRIAFTRMSAIDGGLFVIPATGGTERKLADAVLTQQSLIQPAWSPDGKTLAYPAIDGTGSQVIRLLEFKSSQSLALEPAPKCWHAGAPAWSPDGRQLAFLCMTSVAVYGVYVAEPRANSAPRLLAKLQGFPQGLVWVAAPSRLLVANDSGDGGGVWTLELDGTLRRPAAAEETLGMGLAAGNGRIVYTRSRQVIDIWRLQIDPGPAPPARKWIFSTREQLLPQYSPDGARIAFQSNRSGSPEIWIADADGTNAVSLSSFNGPLTGAPSWCSDGRRLAFDSRESGTSAIYVADMLERVPRRVLTSQSNLALPVWSSDCFWLLASDGREALYRVPAAGGDAQRFTMQRSYQAALVGDRVIFNVADPAGVMLWTKPLAGGIELPLPGMPRLDYADSWTANDAAIYFTNIGESPVSVYRYELATGRMRMVAALPNVPTTLGGLGLAVSRDGKSLLYTHTEDSQSDLVLMTPGK